MNILARSLKDSIMNAGRAVILCLAALAAVSLAACSRPGSAYVGTWVGVAPHHDDVAVITRHGGVFAIQEQGRTEVDYYHLDSQGDLTDGLAVASIDPSTGDLVVHSPFGSETMKRGHRLSPSALRALEARREARQMKTAPMPPL
jgi:hypothetical protein